MAVTDCLPALIAIRPADREGSGAAVALASERRAKVGRLLPVAGDFFAPATAEVAPTFISSQRYLSRPSPGSLTISVFLVSRKVVLVSLIPFPCRRSQSREFRFLTPRRLLMRGDLVAQLPQREVIWSRPPRVWGDLVAPHQRVACSTYKRWGELVAPAPGAR